METILPQSWYRLAAAALTLLSITVTSLITAGIWASDSLTHKLLGVIATVLIKLGFDAQKADSLKLFLHPSPGQGAAPAPAPSPAPPVADGAVPLPSPAVPPGPAQPPPGA